MNFSPLNEKEVFNTWHFYEIYYDEYWFVEENRNSPDVRSHSNRPR